MMTRMIKRHPSYRYAKDALKNNPDIPAYVVKQCRDFVFICDDESDEYIINEKRVRKIDSILKVLKMPKGLKVGQTLYECLAGFQWLLIIATLCIVHRDHPSKRRYETALLEIARKNGKTQIIAILILLLFFIEPQFAYFYSVAPDGSLSREIKKALEEIIRFNPEVLPQEGENRFFKLRRDDIEFLLKGSKYIPLNYSNSRLDGRLPNVFVADEVGALPNSYAVEAMRSGQLTILNKLGFVISTKYPTSQNPFEDEVAYAKKALDGTVADEKVFALLFEPDDTKNWTNNDTVMKQANPLALEIPDMWDDLLSKRDRAIVTESARENFLTKHCNIIYQGAGTESYVSIDHVRECRTGHIDWSGRVVYVGVDLAITTDNCSVAMVAVDDDDDSILMHAMVFIPSGRIEEKTRFEKLDYMRYIRSGQCIACGDMTVDYGVIEQYVFSLEETYGVKIQAIGYDRFNALSSVQKWAKKYTTVEVRQHSDTLHMPTKLLKEKILNKKVRYEENGLLEANFENARCTYDTGMRSYVSKKRSAGKIDSVAAIIDAMYLLQQDIIFGDDGFIIQVG